MLRTHELSKQYEDGHLALDRLNLEIGRGELFCLLGANGAGKTTTINLFLNFIEPTSGEIHVNNINVVEDPLNAKRHISYMSENVQLYDNFTARQNLEFFASLIGTGNISKEIMYDTLDRVGLQKKAFEQKVRNFSKGMRQKTGIAIAIIKDAPAILLDEPTSGLDPSSAAEFMNILLDLRDQGKSIFMSTHDVFRANDYADRVGIMKNGQLKKVFKHEELIKNNLQSIYLDYMRE